jgi:co-chaperonin GroES (HSP10)
MTKDVVLDQTGQNGKLIEKYFPKVNPGVRPFGSRILVQIRGAKTMTAGGIIITDNLKDTERDNTSVAKVLAVGPLAYKNRNTLESWAEGKWCSEGEFVFIPKYGGLRWEVSIPKGVEAFDDKVQFAIIDDLNVIGAVDDPLTIKSFI